jgi:hypothetical protein
MNQRIIDKWKKQGIYEERMKERLARRGRLVHNDPCLKQGWQPAYSGESLVRNAYFRLKAIDPQNPVLKYGVMNEDHQHLMISQDFSPIIEQMYISREPPALAMAGQEISPKQEVPQRQMVVPYFQLLQREYDLVSNMKRIGAREPGIEDRI